MLPRKSDSLSDSYQFLYPCKRSPNPVFQYNVSFRRKSIRPHPAGISPLHFVWGMYNIPMPQQLYREQITRNFRAVSADKVMQHTYKRPPRCIYRSMQYNRKIPYPDNISCIKTLYQQSQQGGVRPRMPPSILYTAPCGVYSLVPWFFTTNTQPKIRQHGIYSTMHALR